MKVDGRRAEAVYRPEEGSRTRRMKVCTGVEGFARRARLLDTRAEGFVMHGKILDARAENDVTRVETVCMRE